MHFHSVISTLTLVATTVTAAAPVVESRDEPMVRLWRDRDFKGPLFVGSGNPGECKDLPGSVDNTISSGRAARNNIICTVFAEKNCQGNEMVSFGDNGDRDFPMPLDKRASSWRCSRR